MLAGVDTGIEKGSKHMATFTPGAQRAVSTAPADEFHPSSTQLAGGGSVVVWTSGNADDATAQQSFAQVYDAQGMAVGGAIQLFTGTMFTTGGAAVGGVAGLPDGSFVVMARTETVDNVNHTPPTWDFYQERIAQDGHVVSGPSLVTSYSSYDEPFAISGPMLVAPDGASYYAQINLIDRYNGVQTAQTVLKHFAADGSAIGEVGASSLTYASNPDAAVLANGNVLTVDTSGRYGQWVDIFAYDAHGNALGHGQVGTSNLGSSNDIYPEIAALADGNALLVSQHTEWNADTQMYTASRWETRVVDANGQVIGGPNVLDIPSNPTAVHLTSLAGGGVIAWWPDGSGDNFAEALDDNGVPSGAAFEIGMGVTAVTATDDGGFLVSSAHNGDIYEQEFDAGPATSAGDELDVNGGISAIPSGDFNIHGGAGLDQIAFAGAHTAYTVTPDSITGPEGTDTLSGIERVRFGDGYGIAFDVTGDAGQAYRLYKAAFDRAPDLPGLGFQMNDLDMGYSLAHVAQNFIDSPEFQSVYGPGLSDTDFITLLYRNVLGREPDQAGLQYHLNEFAQGDTRADMLTHFSESPENQANVVGQIDNGMLFIIRDGLA
jgi:hypothetical protein